MTSQIGFNGPVGCVAVAMSQLMHYWKHPYTGEGSNGYNEDDYGDQLLDCGQDGLCPGDEYWLDTNEDGIYGKRI